MKGFEADMDNTTFVESMEWVAQLFEAIGALVLVVGLLVSR